MPNENSIRALKWNRAHPEKVKLYNNKWRLRRFYGLEQSDLEFMHSQQNGKCAIASCQNRAEHIDHDHATGKVRGLLCPRCNRCLGTVGDSVQLLKDAAAYLENSLRRMETLKGGVPLLPTKRRPMSDKARTEMSIRMRGNKFRIGLPPTNRKKSDEQIKNLQQAQRSWWESLSESEREEWQEVGRQNAKKRWNGK